MPRFEASPHKEAWMVRDNDAAQYHLPEKAVTLYFANEAEAVQVANWLQAEWQRFLADPR